MKVRSVAGALAALAVLAAGGQAQAADYAVERGKRVGAYGASSGFYRGFTGRLPACDDPRVHSTIASEFVRRERGYWNSPLQLEVIGRTAELGYRSWGPEFIPRRFCSAKTVANDGRKRAVYYSIGENLGPIGIGWGIDWCVSGLDRHYAYAPDCKMARP
jgi:hypothetical protein